MAPVLSADARRREPTILLMPTVSSHLATVHDSGEFDEADLGGGMEARLPGVCPWAPRARRPRARKRLSDMFDTLGVGEAEPDLTRQR